ncbi:mechanosensitive ion channel domain-containing protein [Congregibacter litoralis]|uniref:Small-conductance mechanosensitive channel n=1 Tax=Congregibacter litoralis KT71 TaxID=314285 RepID=A4AAG6_9GAMM|nr:mechanosensitive ion channel domain-containing protein [Congregibacter litoralis]EAQ97043.2 Small-conductance mechanosensitive channel [Congregibacter litoralis KT71]
MIRTQLQRAALPGGASRHFFWPLALLILSGLFASQLRAQDLEAADTLEGLQTALSEDLAINDERRAALSEKLQAAAQDRAKLEQFKAARSELEDKLQNSDRLIADYKERMRDIQNAPASIQRRLGENPSLANIETEISIVQSQRDAWAQERSEALDALSNVAKTETAARDRVAEISRRRADDPPRIASEADESDIADRIDNLAASIHHRSLDAEQSLLELRLRSGPTLNSIRTARIAWLDAAIAEADTLLAQLLEAATKKRQGAATQRATEARRFLSQLSGARPELQAMARENLNLVSSFESLTTQIEETRQRVAATRKGIEEIKQDGNLTERRLNVAGLESKLGEVMLTRLASLPDPRVILSRNSDRNEQIASVSIQAIDTEQALRELGDRSGFLVATFGDMASWGAAEKRNAERLYLQRRELLQENMQAGNTLLSLLVDANQTNEELATLVGNYETLLTANLLWVRNYAYADPKRVPQQLHTLVRSRPLLRLKEQWQKIVSDPLFLVLLVFCLSALQHRRITNSLDNTLGKPIRPRDESASLIFKTLALTLLAALALPSLLLLAGRGFYIAASGDPVMMGMGRALASAGMILFVLDSLRRMADRLGLGRRLLKWNNTRVDAATRDLPWFVVAVTSSVAVTILGRAASPTDSGGSLAAAGSLATASFIFIVLLRMLRSGEFHYDRILRYSLQIGALIAASIVFMHLSGQLFAAHLYLRALSGSVAAVTGTLLVANILQRLLIIFRTGLERKAREELRNRAENEDSDEGEEPENSDMEAVSSLSEAYSKLLVVTRLLTLGALLWWIWAPALPALSIFDSITLWTTTDATLPDGELRAITLSVLLLALIIIAVTSLITRHLPPLVNVVLAEWTNVTPGSRYAAGMLMQYLVLGVGLSTALVMLGFQWEKVQWLVAALGVGIGFGLQEIVANFISGLIVLFERPIRVGDIIHAGGADGVVTRINARATVIETFEGKELMIPNKELITSVVTNWSLSNSKLRLVIPIGVAYGSDVDAAMAKLREVALAHPEIIDEPEPYVSFEDFGDNALVLWLRCYALRDYPRVSTELRQIIYREFNAAGISISFPQRDVHLDASEPLPIRILSSEQGPATDA